MTMNYIHYIFLLVALIGYSNALQCYVCSSTTETACGDEKFDASKLDVTSCDGECYKSTASVTFIVTITNVGRGCSNVTCTASSGNVGFAGAESHCCKDKDLCNTASLRIYSLPLVFVTTVTTVLLKKML